MLNRREFLISSMAAAGYAAFGRKYAFAAPLNDAAVKAINLRITCTMEVLKSPKNRNIRIWTPVPFNNSEQQITGLKVKAKMPYKITEDLINKNRMFSFSADSLTKGDKIVVQYNIRRLTSGTSEEKDERPEKFLEPSEWEKWDADIVKYSDSLAGKETDPLKIARRFYDALIDSLTYVHEACGRGVSTLTFEEKKGRCDEFHALFRSMLMYKKIPVKWEQGIALPYPSAIKKTGEIEADCINSLSWVKFHIGGNKWMPVDVSEAKRRPELRDFYFGRIVPNRIKMSNGRGLTLNPPQESPINTFPYTYAEAEGMPLIYGHNYKNVLKYELVRIEA